MDAAWVLHWAAFKAAGYDRDAKGEVLFNRTEAFHLCGLIERAASFPRSGSTHRRSMDSKTVVEAKAAFCRAHKVPHPSAWEWESRRSCEQVKQALLVASVAAKG